METKEGMKHLDTYRLFESSDEIVSTLKDIALDIEDDSFSVRVKSHRFGDIEYEIKLAISKVKGNGLELFDVKDIYNCIKRIVDYMNSEGYITYIQIPQNSKFARVVNVSLRDLPKLHYHITYLDMGFKKSKIRDPNNKSRIKQFESI